jgi:hypothetical protein
MAYESQNGVNDWHIGTATSSDGVNWTKTALSPVMGQTGVMSAGGPWLWKDPATGVFWCWAHVSFPQYGDVGDLPTDGARFSSRDFATWTMNPATLTLARLSYLEGARNPGGQIADLSLLEFGNTTYAYYSTTVSQSVGPAQFMVASAPMTLAQLVTPMRGRPSSLRRCPCFRNCRTVW